MYIYAKKNKMSYPAFLLLDFLAIVISFTTAYVLRMGVSNLINHFSMESVYLQMLLVVILGHVCIVYAFEMYTNIERRGYYREMKAVLENNFLLMFVFLIYIFMTQQSEQYSRKVYMGFFILNIILMYIIRVISKILVKKWMLKTDAVPRMLIVTTSKHVKQVIHNMNKTDQDDYLIKGVVVIDKSWIGKKIDGIPIVADESNAFEYARLAVIDGVFLYLPGDDEAVGELAEVFVDMGITVHMAVNYIPMTIPNKTVQNLGDYAVVSGSMKIATPSQAVVKRTMDILGAVVGLIITGIAFVIVGPIIYMESPGPIFFKQERVGRNGRRFEIYKFRSMYMDAEERKKELMDQNKMKGLMFKMDDDPRITKIGKFIRKTSIDELPQFCNVLKGDMSLVGTRPPTVDEYEQYELHHKKRLSIKPGITGMWQVNGRSNVVDFEEVVKMDTEYIRGWSIALDCKLLLKTVKVVFGDKNAA